MTLRYDVRMNDRRSLERMAETCSRAEQLAFATVWSSEAAHDPFLALMVPVMTTQHVGVGTGIAVAAARTPVATAQLAWDLQRLSHGRFRLGLGSQVRAHVERRYGQPWHGGVSDLREYVACCRHIWERWQHGEKLDFRGKFYRSDLSNPEFQPDPLPDEHARIPVWLAAVGPRMARLAGEIADGVHVHAFHTAGYLRGSFFSHVSEGRRAAGRPEPVAATCPVLAGVVHDERERDAMRDELRRHVAFYASTPAYRPVLESAGCAEIQEPLRQLVRKGRWADLPGIVDDEVLAEFVIVDEAASVGAELRRRYDGVLTHLSLYRDGDRYMTPDDWLVFLDALGHRLPAADGARRETEAASAGGSR